ncbi:MAG: NAD(P)H-hydrate epimerase, partial [Roseovarius gahaiensis]
MTELLTAAQMRAIEQAAIESGDVTGLELMERAGRGVIEAVFEEWPDLAKAPHKAVVLCGPGNNGGDGFVVARLLKDWGWTVQVFLYGDPAKLPPDAKVNYDRWCAIGQVGAIEAAPRFAHEEDLFVDALFGTGLARPLEGAALTWATDREADPDAQGKTVAVDMPSGLCSDSGRELGHNGATVLASLTVSFHAAKLGHYLQCGPFKCGRTDVADIGLRHDLQRDKVRVVEASHAKFFDKVDGAHKYTHGHALVLTGGAGRTGAARLAARGALRVGAGLVTLGAPGSAQMEVACQITALMLRRVDDSAALSGDCGRITRSVIAAGSIASIRASSASMPIPVSPLTATGSVTRGPS